MKQYALTVKTALLTGAFATFWAATHPPPAGEVIGSLLRCKQLLFCLLVDIFIVLIS